MTFYEVRFPPSISADAVGGPSRLTDVVTLRSGFQEANTIWKHSRRKWDASAGIKTYDQLHDVVAFWEAMAGMRHQFRWKDWSDYKSVAPTKQTSGLDQVLGTGDGSKTLFQLTKRYVAGSATYERLITKPVAGTVKVSVAGTPLVAGTGFAVDSTTGKVALTIAPSVGQQVTAGFEFDVPARFATDTLSTHLEHYQLGSASIEIIEVRV